MTTFVQYTDDAKEFEPPAVSVCVHQCLLSSYYTAITTNNNTKVTRNILNEPCFLTSNRTANQFITGQFGKEIDFFANLVVAAVRNSHIRPRHEQVYIKGSQVCLAYKLHNVIDSYSNSYLSYLSQMFTLDFQQYFTQCKKIFKQFDHCYSHTLLTFVHANATIAWLNTDDVFASNYAWLGFTPVNYYRIDSLPYPFATNCRFYAKSQAHCFEKCRMRQYAAATGSVPSDQVLWSEFDSHRIASGNESLWKEVTMKCSKSCALSDCRNVNYESLRPFPSPKRRQVVLLANHVISVKYFAVLKFEQFVIYAGGIVGLWLGVCMMDITNVIA